MRTFKLTAAPAAILLTAAFLGFLQFAAAQTADEASALKEVSKISGQQITSAAQAKEICDLEKYMTDCAAIGKKHNLYKPDEIKQVNAILDELKGKIAEELKSCSDEECLVGVADKLAKSIAKKNPTVAKEIDLTQAKVNEKKTIVNAAKEAGVSFGQCQSMDPDTASVDLLRSCAKLAKDSRVQKHIPEDKKQYVEQNDASVRLREALSSGEYQCGDNTLDGCGKFCMKPSVEARQKGTAAIPQVCRLIAEKFFGQEGVKQLELSYGQVSQAADYYHKKADQATFKTDDGKVLLNPQDIGRYIEEEAKKGNVGVAERGMNFMVAQGFISEEDKEFALKMVRKVKESGKEMNLDDCRNNPEACSRFVPDEEKDRFEASGKVFQIMQAEFKKEGLSDMRVCEDPANAEKCIRASERALPQLKAIAGYSPEAARVVKDVENGIKFSKQGFEAQNKVKKEFQQAGRLMVGEREFKSFEEMNEFCRTNSKECLAAVAQKGFIDKDFAAEKMEKVYEKQAESVHSREFRGEGPYQGFQPGAYPPPGQIQGFTSPGKGFELPSGFDKEKALKSFKEWLDNPEGAPPIVVFAQPPSSKDSQQGDHKAYPEQVIPRCGNAPPQPCPFGEYRKVSHDQNGCPVFGECISGEQRVEQKKEEPPKYKEQPKYKERTYKEPGPLPGVSRDECAKLAAGDPESYHWSDQHGCFVRPTVCPQVEPRPCPQGTHLVTKPWECIGNCVQDSPKKTVCPSMPTVDSCPSGQTKYLNYSSPECGDYYGCKDDKGGDSRKCSEGQYWDGTACMDTGVQKKSKWSNHVWKFKDGATESSYILDRTDGEYLNYISGIESRCLSIGKSQFAWKPNAGDDSSWQNFGIPDCSGRGAIMPTCSSSQYWDGSSCVEQIRSVDGQRQMVWNSLGLSSQIRNDAGTARIEELKQACANVRTGANIWMPNAGSYSSSDFGMPDPNKCRQAANCSTSQYFNGSNCVTSSSSSSSSGWSSDPAAGCAQAGGTWNASTNYCQMPGYSSDPAAACAQANGTWTGSTCQMSASSTGSGSGGTSGSSTTSCPSGQYWNNGACVNTSPTDCTSGYYWNGSSCVPSGSGSGSATTCSSGQYWNGSSCVTSSSGGGGGTMDPAAGCAQAGGTWNASTNYCQMPGSSSGSTGGGYSSDPATACGQAGGTWNGSMCQMPGSGSGGGTTSGSTSGGGGGGGGGTMDPATGCAQAGGTWNGSTCQMPGSGGGGGALQQIQSSFANMQSAFQRFLNSLGR